jgi:hypothetical protein
MGKVRAIVLIFLIALGGCGDPEQPPTKLDIVKKEAK